MDEREWAICEPLLPAPAWLAGKGGRPSAYCMRDIVDGIRYLTHNGPVWRALPADFPPAWTIYYWAAKWQADGSAENMHDRLRDRVRELAGRKAAPTAAIIDSQSVKAVEEVARSSRGYDAGKKVSGRKRHIAVDVMGLLLTVLVTAASVQDRDAAKPLLWNLRRAFPAVRLAWADGGYAGRLVTWADKALKLTLQIVRRPDDLHTFKVLPRRWVVERTLAWITRHRRTVRDYERVPAHHETCIYWSMIIVMSRRLARKPRPDSASPSIPPQATCSDGGSRCPAVDAAYDYTARALPVTELMDLLRFDDLLDDEQRLIQETTERRGNGGPGSPAWRDLSGSAVRATRLRPRRLAPRLSALSHRTWPCATGSVTARDLVRASGPLTLSVRTSGR